MGDEKREIDISPEQWSSHRRLLIEHQCEQASAFQKHVLAVSTGAIGLSSIFFFNLVTKASMCAVPLLIIAWTCFALAIAATLVSFVCAQVQYAHRIAEWDKMYEEGVYDQACASESKYESRCKWLQRSAMIAFFLGMVMFTVFAVVNLSRATDRRRRSEQESPRAAPEQTNSVEGTSPPGAHPR